MKRRNLFVLASVLCPLVILAGVVATVAAMPLRDAGSITRTIAAVNTATALAQQAIIIDHSSTDLDKIPAYWIEQAKAALRTSYGHTSHGSQPISGMEVLMVDPLNNGLYDFTTDGSVISETLSLTDSTPEGDLGNPDYVTWEARTRDYLAASGSDRNVVIWSWCGQASTSESNIETYLSLMNGLETDFPDVTFVYMTGHLEGTGVDGELYQRNNQIRDYCIANNKILYDFADIESYDPDGNYYPDADDGCDWCTDWCDTHPEDCTNLPDSCAHSHPLNCMLKGKAFWWMMARIAGWNGVSEGESRKTASSSTAEYGDTITYTIVIQGLAAPPTTTLTMTDEIPSGITYIPGTFIATAGTANNTNPSELRWSGMLTPTRVVTCTYSARVTGVTPTLWTATNKAVISAPGYQTITRTATVTISPNPQIPDFSTSYKSVFPSHAITGEHVTYTVSIRNTGTPMTNTVYFTDTIPVDLTYLPGSLTATNGAINDNAAPTLTWSGVLSPTTDVTLTYATNVMSTVPKLVINNAEFVVDMGSDTLIPNQYHLSTRLFINCRCIYLPLLLR